MATWDLLGLLVFALVFWILAGTPWRACGQWTLMPPAPTPETNWFYFSATAQDDRGLESDYSNEVLLATTNKLPLKVQLAWDPSPGTNYITNYAIYEGTDSYTYTQKVNVGQSLTGAVVILPRVWTTVVSFGCVDAPGLTLTNPSGKLFVRAKAWKVWNEWPTVLQGAPTPNGPWSDLSGIVTNHVKPELYLRVRRWRE